MTFCPSCGLENKEGAKFCKNCGKNLPSGPAAASSPTPRASSAASHRGATKASAAPTAASSASTPAASSATAGSGSAATRTYTSSPSSVVSIKDGIISWPETMIVQSYIEKITTKVPLPAFPIVALILLIVGIVVTFFGSNHSFQLFVAGIAVVVIAVLWFAWWLYKRATAPKGIFIHLNSGNDVTIFLNNRAEADRIVEAIRESIAGQKTEVTINYTSATNSSH